MTVIDENASKTYASGVVAEMSVHSVTAGEEYSKNPELKQEDIVELKSWAESKKLPPISDELLILFYHSCMYDMKATQSCIEVYYDIRKNSPEFFENRDVSRPNLQHALTVLQYSCLPVKDQHGYQIIYHGLQQYEASKYVFNDGVKLLVMAIDACLCVEGTVPGYVFLFNMKGVRFSHLMRLSVSSMRKFFRYIQEGLPVRLKAIHVVNTLPLIDKVMFMIKPFMKKELLSLIHFHSSNYEEVQQFLPKNCLPSDFGGDLPTLNELHQQFCEWMARLTPQFLEGDKLYNNEATNKAKN